MLTSIRWWGLAALLIASALHRQAAAQPCDLGSPASLEQAVEQRLTDLGLENIGTEAGAGYLLVTYENRRYRHELRALQETLKHAMPLLPGPNCQLRVVVQQRRMPVVRVVIEQAAYQAFVEGRIDGGAFGESITAARAAGRRPDGLRNASQWKAEVVLHPQLAARFGNFGDMVRSQVNVAPEAVVSLWPGMRLAGQVILPIQNELRPADSYVRPGLVTLSQTLRLPLRTYLMATVGYFTEDRYGLDVQTVKYAFGSRLALHARGGYTAFALFDRGAWLYDTHYLATWFAGAAYRVLPRYDLTVGVTYGSFFYDEEAVRVDISRRFGEVELGFYGVLATSGEVSQGENAGFRITVPLVPRKYARPGRLRLRPARTFSWEYRYRKLFDQYDVYETGLDLRALLGELDPAYVKNNLGRLPGWR